MAVYMAKGGGICPRCRRNITEGQLVKRSGRGREMHIRCPIPGVSNGAQDEVAAAERFIEDARTRVEEGRL